MDGGNTPRLGYLSVDSGKYPSNSFGLSQSISNVLNKSATSSITSSVQPHDSIHSIFSSRQPSIGFSAIDPVIGDTPAYDDQEIENPLDDNFGADEDTLQDLRTSVSQLMDNARKSAFEYSSRRIGFEDLSVIRDSTMFSISDMGRKKQGVKNTVRSYTHATGGNSSTSLNLPDLTSEAGSPDVSSTTSGDFGGTKGPAQKEGECALPALGAWRDRTSRKSDLDSGLSRSTDMTGSSEELFAVPLRRVPQLVEAYGHRASFDTSEDSEKVSIATMRDTGRKKARAEGELWKTSGRGGDSSSLEDVEIPTHREVIEISSGNDSPRNAPPKKKSPKVSVAFQSLIPSRDAPPKKKSPKVSVAFQSLIPSRDAPPKKRSPKVSIALQTEIPSSSSRGFRPPRTYSLPVQAPARKVKHPPKKVPKVLTPSRVISEYKKGNLTNQEAIDAVIRYRVNTMLHKASDKMIIDKSGDVRIPKGFNFGPSRDSKGRVVRKGGLTRIEREILAYQKSTHLLIPRSIFARVVREIAQSWYKGEGQIKFTLEALTALQAATEDEITKILEISTACSHHAKRITLRVDDMRLARFCRGRQEYEFFHINK